MSDIGYDRTERDEKGNVIKVHMYIGGKKGYFFRNRANEIEWFCVDFGEPEPRLVGRARKQVRDYFPTPPRRSFPQALAPELHKQTLWVFVRLVLPDSDGDEQLGRWFGMNLRSGKQFTKPLCRDEHNPFSGKESDAMWAEGNRVLAKKRRLVLFSRQQKDMFADAE